MNSVAPEKGLLLGGVVNTIMATSVDNLREKKGEKRQEREVRTSSKAAMGLMSSTSIKSQHGLTISLLVTICRKVQHLLRQHYGDLL